MSLRSRVWSHLRPAFLGLALVCALPTGCEYPDDGLAVDEGFDEGQLLALAVPAAKAKIAINRASQAAAGTHPDTVIAQSVAAGESLDANEKSALWDFYKAKIGQDGGVIKGAARRERIKWGHNRLREHFLADRAGNETEQRKLEKAVAAIWTQSLVDEGVVKGRVALIMDELLTPIYVYLPATITTPNGSTANVDQRVEMMKTAVRWLPLEHRKIMYPIFVIDRKPSDDSGGGTWKPEVTMSAFSPTEKEARTKVPWAEMKIIVGTRADGNLKTGVIGIPRNRMNANSKSVTRDGATFQDEGFSTWGFTVTHEAGHAVDFAYDDLYGEYGMQYGDVVANLWGQTYVGDTTPPPMDRVAETYSRYFMRNTKMCRDGANDLNIAPSATVADCNANSIKYMNKAPALADPNPMVTTDVAIVWATGKTFKWPRPAAD